MLVFVAQWGSCECRANQRGYQQKSWNCLFQSSRFALPSMAQYIRHDPRRNVKCEMHFPCLAVHHGVTETRRTHGVNGRDSPCGLRDSVVRSYLILSVR